MSSATPTRPGSSPGLAALGLAALVTVVVVVAVIWLIAAGGVFSAFGRWMYASDVGTALRYIIEALALLVCVLL